MSAFDHKEPKAPKVVLITKKERDDLRRFNVEMRKLLKEFVEISTTTPLDVGRYFAKCTEAFKSLHEQRAAGFEP